MTHEIDKLQQRLTYHQMNNYGTAKHAEEETNLEKAVALWHDQHGAALEQFLSMAGERYALTEHGAEFSIEELTELVSTGEKLLSITPNLLKNKYDLTDAVQRLRANLRIRNKNLEKYGKDLPVTPKREDKYGCLYNRNGYASNRIRKWLTENGVRLPSRGHIPNILIDYYVDSHKHLQHIGEVWTSRSYQGRGFGEFTMQIELWCYRCADTHARTSGIPTQRGEGVHGGTRTPGPCPDEWYDDERTDSYYIVDHRPIPEWEYEERAKYLMS